MIRATDDEPLDNGPQNSVTPRVHQAGHAAGSPRHFTSHASPSGHVSLCGRYDKPLEQAVRSAHCVGGAPGLASATAGTPFTAGSYGKAAMTLAAATRRVGP